MLFSTCCTVEWFGSPVLEHPYSLIKQLLRSNKYKMDLWNETKVTPVQSFRNHTIEAVSHLCSKSAVPCYGLNILVQKCYRIFVCIDTETNNKVYFKWEDRIRDQMTRISHTGFGRPKRHIEKHRMQWGRT